MIFFPPSLEELRMTPERATALWMTNIIPRGIPIIGPELILSAFDNKLKKNTHTSHTVTFAIQNAWTSLISPRHSLK